MPITFVNSTGLNIATAASTWSIPTHSSREGGAAFIVYIGTGSTAVTVSTVTDNTTNVYRPAVATNGRNSTNSSGGISAFSRCAIWYATNISSASTRISVTLSGTSSGGIHVGQFQGVSTHNACVGGASSLVAANSTVKRAAFFTPPTDNCLVTSVGRCGASTISPIRNTASFTTLISTNQTVRMHSNYWIQTARTGTEGGFTHGGAATSTGVAQGCCVMAVFSDTNVAATLDTFHSTFNQTVSSVTWSHDVRGNTNRAAYVFAGGWDGTGRTVEVTFGGSSMTQIADTGLSNGNDREWVFRLLNPNEGPNTVSVNVTGGTMHLIATSFSVNGAHQSEFNTPVTNVSAANSTESTVTVTQSTNGVVLDGHIWGSAATSTAKGTSTHVERTERIIAAAGESGGGGFTLPSGAADDIGWSYSLSNSWALAAVAVNAASTGGGGEPPPTAFKRMWRMGALGCGA